MKKMGNLSLGSLNPFKKRVIAMVSLILLIGFMATVLSNYNNKTSIKHQNLTQSSEKTELNQVSQDEVGKEIASVSTKSNNKETHKDSELLKPLKSDFALGNKNAPVLFIEYASLSCPHCAVFTREAFDKLRSEFIDTGKILFIYRDFPINHQALAAAMIAQCRAIENASDSNAASEKFYSTLKIIFRTQDSWAFDQKFIEKLETIFKLDGMTSESFKDCLADKKLQEKILQHRMKASQSLDLQHTPTFYVNGEAIEGYVDYKSIKELVERKLDEALPVSK